MSTKAKGQSLPGLAAPLKSELSSEEMGTGHPALGVEWPGGLGHLAVTAAPNTPGRRKSVRRRETVAGARGPGLKVNIS